MQTLRVKRGTTITLRAALKSPQGVPVDITGYAINCSVSDLFFAPKYTLTCTVVDASQGSFNLSAQTTTWAAGLYQFDIDYTDLSGNVVSTDTVRLEVYQNV